MRVQHRDVVPWYQAPIPRHWHRCTPWSTFNGYGVTPTRFCACGGHNVGTPVWYDRNSRRKQAA